MPRPPSALKTHVDTIIDPRLKKLVSIAIECEISVPDWAARLGHHQSVLHRAFESQRCADQTIEKYAQALSKDGVIVCSKIDARIIAGTVTEEELQSCVLTQIRKIEICSGADFPLVKSVVLGFNLDRLQHLGRCIMEANIEAKINVVKETTKEHEQNAFVDADIASSNLRRDIRLTIMQHIKDAGQGDCKSAADAMVELLLRKNVLKKSVASALTPSKYRMMEARQKVDAMLEPYEPVRKQYDLLRNALCQIVLESLDQRESKEIAP